MAIVVEGTTTGGVGDTGGDSSTLTSWTPASNELILLFVAMRDEEITATASGNGITFTQIHDINNIDLQGGITVFRGMSASPSSGSITVTHTGNTLPVSCVAARFSGVDTTGTNGSGAIGNTNSDQGPVGGDANVQISVTVSNSAHFAVGSAWHRGQVLDNPPDTGETTIVLNSAFGTGGSTTHCSVWYQTGSAGSIQLGTANDLDASGDHVESAIEVKTPAGPEPDPDQIWIPVRYAR